MIRNLTIAALAAVLTCGCTGEPKEKPHEPHDHVGPHGGAALEVGDHAAHLEVLHDEATGKLTLHVLGADAKTAVAISKPLEIKLKDGKSIVMTMVGAKDGKSSEFTATDDALKGHPEGRITTELDGKTYNTDLEFDHDH